MSIQKELKYIHLEEGLKAFNDSNDLRLMAIYLSTSLEVLMSLEDPKGFQKKLELAADLDPEEAREIRDFFIPLLQKHAANSNKPFGASEKQMVEMLELVKSLSKQEVS
mgnify:CR=1 FL=1